MKIENLRLKNFLCHRDTEIDLSAPITIFVGPNNAGKTSIADAIEMLLLGHCRSTDKRGAGSAQLVTTGEKGFEVTGTVDGHVLSRRFTMTERGGEGRFKVEKWNGSSSLLQEKFLKEIAGGVSDDTLTSIIRSSKFIEMSHDERKAVLFGLQGIELNHETVLQSLVDWLRTHQEEVDADLAVGFLKGQTSTADYMGGPEVFPVLKKVCEEMRRALNRDVKSQEAVVESIEIPELPKDVTVDNLPAMRDLLDTLEKERDELLKKQGANSEQLARKSELQERQKSLQDEIARIQRARREEPTDTKALEKESAELEKEKTELEGDRNNLKAEYDTNQRKLAEIQAAVRLHQQQLENLETLEPGVCPISEKLTCPHPKTAISKVKKELKDSLNESEREQKKAQKDVALLRDRIADRDIRLRSMDGRMTDVKDRLERAKQSALMMKRDEERRSQLEKELTQVSLKLKEVLFVEEDKEISRKLSEVEARIADGRQLIPRVERAAETTERKAEERAKLALYRAEAIAWDALVQALSPKGIPSEMLRERLVPIEDRANEKLAQLSGGRYQIHFRTENENFKGESEEAFDIMVKSPKTDWRRIENCSDSEKARLGIVLADALNHQAKLGLLIFDNAEKLTTANRTFLTQTALSLVQEEDYQNFIILGTKDEDARLAAYPSDLVRMYRLLVDSEGDLSTVERVA